MKVFLAGLSRSGKTSRARYAAENLPDIDYVSVSKLLRSAGGTIPVETVSDCLANQRHAIDALRSFQSDRLHQLIDGHAMIETAEGPCLVPDWFFDNLAPHLIIYVHDLPAEIISRRQFARNRISAADIAALNQIELAACQRTAARLKISLIVLEAPSLEAFVNELRRCLPNNQQIDDC